jgi:intracellular sulfur oxidation DsrE/DsrF family protein
MHYLMVLFHMLNMGVQVQICAREVIWMVYNNKKLVNFCEILYCLKVIFLQHDFEALNNVFSY